ncbi:LRR receptor-like serine/threonine-protein kinase ERECTA [Vitis vinifera]|uniref:LRR receptor-like serine/threonine-protein kinase ERECTA n=1 Tax=Vitis vinifera TaxID=29760 RepID=A0A438HH48_VITVI|nr:LRR receptor-like serine/threonine-protein kinase ERECTA [Vitis vinifera]
MVKISILGFLLVILCLITRDLACKGETLEGNCLRADREALLDFKNGLKDSSDNRLSSWIGGNCCQWEGIGCENNTGVVISIDLHNPYYLEEAYENWSSMNLSGEIRPSLIELKYLRSLDLSGNSFEHIPIPKFFGSLKSLQYLNLSNCGFRGAIPPTLGNLSNLQFLDLSSIESQLFVKNLEWMTNLVSLRHLKLNYVNLSMVGSHWMEVFSKLSFLTELHLQHCGLSRSISSLNSINFTSLTVISISGNSFRSKFPIWLLNISSLVYIDVSSNQLYGHISPGLGKLPNLQHLDLSWNEDLTGSFSEFLEEIKNCSSEGPLPELGYLDLSWNQLVGRLPERLSQLEKLTYLDLSYNKLQGPIPASFGTFKNLNEMRLQWNELNGSLPLSKLKTLWMGGNSGPSFPTWLRSQKEVSYLYLSNASISGPSFPTWLRSQKQLLADLSNASISGTIPDSIGHITLLFIDFSRNNLTGSIPSTINNCSSLIVLDLGNNNLSGTIPDSIGHLSFLEVIDFSRNNLIGSIPYTIVTMARITAPERQQAFRRAPLIFPKFIKIGTP